MATIAIMVGGAVLNAATFIGGNYLAKYLTGDSGQAALDEKKRHERPLRSINGTTRSTKRIALSSWTGLHNKTAKRTKPSTTSRIPTQPWNFTTKRTKQRSPCHRNPGSLTTTSPARNRRMASCFSLAPAPSLLDMLPFAFCEPYARHAHAPRTH